MERDFSFKTYKAHQDSYFFIKDKVDSREVSIEHCLKGMIWVNVLPKPMQGQSLKEMKVALMNCDVH